MRLIQGGMHERSTLGNLARVCRGTYCGGPEEKDREVESIVTDSRQVQPGALFVAIPGQRVDGHTFIEDVVKKERWQSSRNGIWGRGLIRISMWSPPFRL